MKHTQGQDRDTSQKERSTIPTPSAVLDDGAVVELVFDKEKETTQFVVGRDGAWEFKAEVERNGSTLVPYRASNNLLRHSVILFPSEPAEYETDETLVDDIEAYLHRYIDLTPQFKRMAAHYVLLSWVYDRFNEVPYLRVRGDYGTGKTRFLLVAGAVLYKPIFASGASTVSPIFHMLDRFRGCLILDEADFRFSDEKAEMVKILNNGNARGFPILRTMMNDKREFNPRAFHVFGPKIVATRGHYDDQALESRFITEEMHPRPVRRDVPINLPDEQKAEALALRNKLLLYRIRNYHTAGISDAAPDHALEGRINQIVLPLLSVATDGAIREELGAYAKGRSRDLKNERGMTTEAQILEVICDLKKANSSGTITLKKITATFRTRFGQEYDDRITNRWIGSLMRRQLLLKPRKSHGNLRVASRRVRQTQTTL